VVRGIIAHGQGGRSSWPSGGARRADLPLDGGTRIMLRLPATVAPSPDLLAPVAAESAAPF